MKTKFRLLFVMFFVLCFVLSGLTVSAGILPVKNAWILGRDLVAVLREDGTLLIANAIDAEETAFVSDNVADFCSSISHNGTMRGLILYKNGDLATLYNPSYNTENSNYKTKNRCQ